MKNWYHIHSLSLIHTMFDIWGGGGGGSKKKRGEKKRDKKRKYIPILHIQSLSMQREWGGRGGGGGGQL